MKKYIFTLLIICLMSHITQAQPRAILNGYIGETFSIAEPYIEFLGYTTDLTSEFKSVKTCDNTRYYKIYLFGGLVKLEEWLTVPFAVEKKDRRCVPKKGFEFSSTLNLYDTKFSLPSRQGHLLQQELKKDPFLAQPIGQTIVFGRLSSDGSSMDVLFGARGGYISEKSSTGQLRFGANMKIKQCIDSYGNNVGNFIPNFSGSGIRAAISHLRSLNRQQLERCDLVIEYRDDHQIDVLPFEFKFKPAGNYYDFSIFSGHDQILLMGSPELARFERVGDAIDAASTQRAFQARDQFVNLLANDYGDLLYELSARQMSPDEKDEALKAFYENNGHLLKLYLKQIENEFSRTSLLTKIAIIRSLNQVYATVAAMERMSANSSAINLDRYIEVHVR